MTIGQMYQKDLKYATLVQRNYNFDYMRAQEYYKSLRERMLNELSAFGQQQMATKTAQKTLADLENQIKIAADQAAADSTQTATRAREALESLDGLDVNSALMRAVKNAAEQAKQALGTERDKVKKYDSKFVSQVKTALGEASLQAIDTVLKTTNFFPGTTGVVSNSIRNYFLRTLINRSLEDQPLLNTALASYAQAVGGYFKEQAVVEAFNQAANKVNARGGHSRVPQVVDIASKNLPSDFIFNTVVDEQAILDLCAQGHLGQVHMDRLIYSGVDYAIQQGAQVFGAQIKSFNLLNNSMKLTRTWFPIGSRSSLKSGLESSEEYLHGKSMAANMAYMGQLENIKTALGAQNVMFVAGSKSYWMDQFIETFRIQKLYLSLDTHWGSTLKDSYITSEVSLLKYSRSKMAELLRKTKS